MVLTQRSVAAQPWTHVSAIPVRGSRGFWGGGLCVGHVWPPSATVAVWSLLPILFHVPSLRLSLNAACSQSGGADALSSQTGRPGPAAPRRLLWKSCSRELRGPRGARPDGGGSGGKTGGPRGIEGGQVSLPCGPLLLGHSEPCSARWPEAGRLLAAGVPQDRVQLLTLVPQHPCCGLRPPWVGALGLARLPGPGALSLASVLGATSPAGSAINPGHLTCACAFRC